MSNLKEYFVHQEDLREAVLTYIDSMVSLGHTLMGAVSLSLGLKESFFRERYMSPEPLSLFR